MVDKQWRIRPVIWNHLEGKFEQGDSMQMKLERAIKQVYRNLQPKIKGEKHEQI